jgi:starch synthase (maltosyl-transferring)
LERFSSSLHKSAARTGALPARAIVESVRPEVDCGRFPVKRALGDEVVVEADVFADGHDAVQAALLYKHSSEKEWREMPMEFLGNDHWRATFRVEQLGRYEYTVRGWTDPFLTWQRDLVKRREAEQDLSVDFLIGAELIDSAVLRDASRSADERYQAAMKSSSPRSEERTTTYERVLQVVVDPVKARFSSWYELFPRSLGTFRDVIAHLPYVAELGFDVLYLPPIHPIGVTGRKGKNNTLAAEAGDVGSPWAIGAKEGGHKAIHPDLGTFDDFSLLVKKAKDFGIDIALDIAFQCSPDHPYVKEHPKWFRWRPDGTVQYAENPPKKYQDIYPFEFESEEWPELFDELKSVFEFWISRGVTIFRVDNPHTKPFGLWEYIIPEIKAVHPEVIFLAEAFTRPRIMHRLAKLGFTQSYTYFTWRNSKAELTEYFSEIAQGEEREYFRPNLWPNTPDILHAALQHGGRAAFIARLVLAATAGANYGVYGPAYELMEHTAREPGSEEYLSSEKYEIKHWDVDHADSLKGLIRKLNEARKTNPALQSDWSLSFHGIDNDQLICYSKRAGDNAILVIVNLDPRFVQSGWTALDLEALGLVPGESYEVHDLLGGGQFGWTGAHNYVELSPHALPAHVFRIVRRIVHAAA